MAMVAGCAGAASENGGGSSFLDKLLAVPPPAEAAAPPPPPVEHHGCGSPSQCKSALKKMVDSPKRGWVGQEQAPAAYTDGTRLFAYRALRPKLTCRELGLALNEVRAASKSLSGDVAGVPKDQLARTRSLNSQVESELAKESSKRCKA
jgi:hypothetical protein